MSVPLLPFLAVSSTAFATCLSRSLFLSAMLLSPSVSSFSLSFLFLPLGFSLFFCRTSLTRSRWLQPFAPSPCCPRHGVRLPCEPQRRCGRRVRHAHCLRVHASCRLGGFAKRRGNAGSHSELPYHLNTFLEARWDCVFASTLSHPPLALALALALALTLTHFTLSLCNLSECSSARAHAHFLPFYLSHALSSRSHSRSRSLSLSLSLSLSHSYSRSRSHSLRNLSDSPSTQPKARFVPSLSSLALSLLLLPPLLRLRLRFVFLFVLSSSSS